MARVWYVGTYPYREITPQDWDRLGLFGPHYQWSADNGWSVDQSLFRPELLAALENDPEFMLNQEGVRPDTPLPPDDVTRPWKADPEILALVDDAFEALGLAEDALEDISSTLASANAAASQAGTYRNEAQGFRNEAEGFKTAAGTSASSASGSAATATTKAGEASASAAAALTSEGKAKTSETNAAGSATAADTSRNQAQGFRNEASNFRNQAQGFRNEAEGFAGTASTKATEAANSAATLVRRVNRGGREIAYMPDGRPYLLDPEEVEEVPFEIDTSVGTRIMLGGHMVYGDTGWRRIDTSSDVASGEVFIKRVNNLVTLRLANVILAAGTGYGNILNGSNSTPDGFRPELGERSLQMVGSSKNSVVPQRISIYDSNVTWGGKGVDIGGTRPTDDLSGTMKWTTSQPWPTSLPGTAA